MESKKTIVKNEVIISGEVIEKLKLDHEFKGMRFYSTYIQVERISDKIDVIPIIIPESLLKRNHIKGKRMKGKYIRCKGQFRSYNIYTEVKEDEDITKGYNGKKLHVRLYVYVNEIEELKEDERIENYIYLDGFLCKTPIYRSVEEYREKYQKEGQESNQKYDITDLIIAVGRNGHADYIPCIAWDRDARFIAKLNTGKHIRCYGRIQSRKYFKRYQVNSENDGVDNDYANEKVGEWRTAYEVVIGDVYAVDEE